MKRYLLLLGLALFYCPLSFAITEVQHKIFASSAASTTTAPITVTSTGANNLYVVCAIMGDHLATLSVTDNATGGSNTYVEATNAKAVGSAGDWDATLDCFYVLKAPRSGATTVTATTTLATNSIQIAEFWEVSGFTTAAFDLAGHVQQQTVSGGVENGASITTTGTTEFVVGAIMGSTVTANPQAGNEFTAGGDIDATFGDMAFVSLITTTAAAHQPIWTVTGAILYSTATVAFKETAVSGAPGSTIAGPSTIGGSSKVQ